ncbi:hypothetical protein [Embleya sp. NPDC005575]|uniref:hypothetical protein n=1 Tax=Embleya sp. NPDC005575 TaxID=3156892 RepID=UPI0033AE6D98
MGSEGAVADRDGSGSETDDMVGAFGPVGLAGAFARLVRSAWPARSVRSGLVGPSAHSSVSRSA